MINLALWSSSKGKFSKSSMPFSKYCAMEHFIRGAESGVIQIHGRPKLELTKLSFKWRGSAQFNQLPADIRLTECESTFKVRTKIWIMEKP